MADATALEEDWPTMVQGSALPLFKGKGESPLTCRSCGASLFEGFEPNKVLAIDLECFKCGTKTRSPGWELAGPLPQRVGSIGEKGRFYFEGTIDLAPLVPFGSQQEINRVDEIYGPRRPTVKHELSLDSLAEIVTRLNVVSAGELSKALEVTRRHFALGQDRFLEYPLAWAIVHLERCLARRQIDANSDDGAAVKFLQTALGLVDMWMGHPVFPSIAKGLVHEFHHISAMLISASYMQDHGNRVGITEVESEQGRKSPDLYVRFGSDELVSIEVKAPKVLQWPSEPNIETIEEAIGTQIKRAKKQITGEAGGVLVIGASSRLATSKSVRFAIGALIRKNKVSSKMAAVVTVCAKPIEVRGRAIDTDAYVDVLLNPRFSGEQFVAS